MANIQDDAYNTLLNMIEPAPERGYPSKIYTQLMRREATAQAIYYIGIETPGQLLEPEVVAKRAKALRIPTLFYMP